MALKPLREIARKLVRWAKRGFDISSDGLAYLFGYRPTLSGVVITDQTALEAPAYFAGIRNLAEDLATLPLLIYRRLDARRRTRDPDHPLYPILHELPNEETDIVQFIEMMQAWLMMRRNAYAEVVRTGAGRVVALWPIPPRRVTVRRIEGQLIYTVMLPDGMRDPVTGLPFSALARSQILHLKAFALDGVMGTSSISLHQESIGLALALERYGAAFFGNDATPGGVYEHPGKLTDEAYARMKPDLEDPHRGLANAHRVALLEEGLKFHETSTPNDKAQFIESQRHSTEQMARLNRIPPHMIQDLSHATFSNIEHQSIDYVTYSIRPWAVRWEKGILTQLMLPAERRTHYAEFLLDALLRADSKTRAETLNVQRQSGVINADEWRELENMNPIEDGSGQVYLVNGSMLPVALAGASRTPVQTMQPQRAFRPLFVATAERCVRREAADVARAAERIASEGVARFEARVVEAYRGHAEAVHQAWMPLAVAVGETIRGQEGPDLGEWAERYVRDVAALRERAAKEAIRDVLASGTSDLAGKLKSMTDSWIREEPARMADRESRALVESLGRWLREAAAAAAA